MQDINKFKVLTFDCYGTLIDWETGILAVLRPWARQHDLDLTDDDLLEMYGEAETRWEAVAPTARYSDLLRIVQADISRKLNIQPNQEESDALADSVRDWPAFPDSVEALAVLKKTHKLVILSNIDRESFSHSNAKLHVQFDAIITAEEAAAYKPNTSHFTRCFKLLADWGIEQREILHVAQSLYHDHVPAKRLGLTTAWVDRRRGKQGYGATPAPAEEVTPDIVVANMAELAAMAT